jgi:membrane-associated phospholipid phosphatase
MNLIHSWVILCLLILPCTLRAQRSLQYYDEQVLLDLAKNRTPQQTGVYMFLSNNYKVINAAIPAGLLATGVVTDNKEMRQNSVYVLSSTLVSYGLNAIIKGLVKRRRPFIRNINIVPVYEANRYSFPSGHTSSTMATATALSIAYPKWYVIAPSFLWAGATSYSRMYLGVHYPTDVAAGLILGPATAVSMQFLKAKSQQH